MPIVIIDYGMGNLGSVQRSLEVCGVDAFISEKPEDLKTASGILLPGVGAFGDAMEHLTEQGWVEALHEEAIKNKIPLLGICLGMQLLGDGSTEGKPAKGLGFIKGHVVKLEPTDKKEKVPHVGWNEVTQKANHPIFADIADHKDFYFVHSYHFIAESKTDVIGTTPYCGEVAAVIAHENIIGAQFHPEKSQVVGLQLLKNFAKLC